MSSKYFKNAQILFFSFGLILTHVIGQMCHGESAQDIFDRSNQVMGPPIKYRLIANGISSLVYKKKLADDLVGIRVETEAPLSVVRLVIRTDHFEIYAKEKVVIDMGFIYQQSARVEAFELLGMAGQLNTPFAMGTMEIVSEVEFGGKKCWKLSRSISSDSLTLLTKSMPAAIKDKIPIVCYYFIEKKTYEVVGSESFSAAGEKIVHAEYRQIQRLDDILDELFLPPPEFKKWKPQSIFEYSSMLMELVSKESKPSAVGRSENSFEIDQKTGLMKLQAPPGMNQKLFEQKMEEARRTRPLREAMRSLHSSDSDASRKIADSVFYSRQRLYTLLFCVFALMMFVCFLRVVRSPSN